MALQDRFFKRFQSVFYGDFTFNPDLKVIQVVYSRMKQFSEMYLLRIFTEVTSNYNVNSWYNITFILLDKTCQYLNLRNFIEQYVQCTIIRVNIEDLS